MNILSEEQVYLGTKELLKNNNFILIGGQPARGTDHLPVIEIKSGDNFDKGSKYSYKPDLVAFKKDTFYIIECKPQYDIGDSLKLNNIIKSNDRLLAFFNELNQRGLLKKINYTSSFEIFKNHINIALAYSGDYVCDTTCTHITINNFMGDGCIHSNK